MVNRYSLADHTVQITFPKNFRSGTTQLGGTVFTIGGPGENKQTGSFVGSIKVSRKNPTWDTEGDPTGSWVHNKSLDRTGNVSIDLRQISDDILRLIMIATIFENDQEQTEGCLIQVFSATGEVAKAEDCYITKIPDQDFGEKAATQPWEWTAGRVTFPQGKATWPKERV